MVSRALQAGRQAGKPPRKRAQTPPEAEQTHPTELPRCLLLPQVLDLPMLVNDGGQLLQSELKV